MSVIDRFLSAIKMNDDEGFGEDDYFDEEDDSFDEYEEERPKRRILTKTYDEDEDLDETPVKKQAPAAAAPAAVSAGEKTPKAAKPARTSKVSPMRPRKGTGMEVCIIRPKSMEDASEITDTLLDNCTVILNMEGLDMDLTQRVIDFACGSCYAMHGNLQRISNSIFIVTPESVDISGDFQEVLTGVFDVPAFGTRF